MCDTRKSVLAHLHFLLFVFQLTDLLQRALVSHLKKQFADRLVTVSTETTITSLTHKKGITKNEPTTINNNLFHLHLSMVIYIYLACIQKILCTCSQ